MSSSFEAIYEKGVLKPLEAVDFKDGEKVRVSVEAIPKAKFEESGMTDNELKW